MGKLEKEPLVSIITPLYNTEKFIGETIESVLNQTYQNWEMIIVDDCSKDSSVKIVEKYTREEIRINLIKNKKNLEVTKTRNKAIELSKGKYIAFLDADDLWKKEKLEKQIKFMEKNKVKFSYTGYEKITEDGKKRGVVNVPLEVDYKTSLKGNVMGCLTVVYNQEILGKRYFRELKMSEDHVLWLQMLKECTAYGICENLSKYRVLDNSRSSNKIEAVKYQWYIMREIEKLNKFKSIFYFYCYLYNGYRRYRK